MAARAVLPMSKSILKLTEYTDSAVSHKQTLVDDSQKQKRVRAGKYRNEHTQATVHASAEFHVVSWNIRTARGICRVTHSLQRRDAA